LIDAYYARGQEQGRLETVSQLEFLRTTELLGRFLPPVPGRIVDVGGGPGRYAQWLQGLGYEVLLVDPVELHVGQALAAGVEAYRGDARQLPFPERSADAVLLLGPLYHLQDRADRIDALAEARRVLRPQGVVVTAAISRFASTYDGLLRGFLTDPAFEDIVDHDVTTGRHDNPSLRPGWFTTSYFHLPSELSDEIKAVGLVLDKMVAVEGPGVVFTDPGSWMADERRREILLRAIRRVESDPSILGASSHFLAIAHKGE
jgi:SAM-dependent methyltransferase